MPRNGSGTYTPAVDFTTEAGSPPIEISKLDQQMDDLATAISASIASDGQTQPSANLPMNGFKHTNVANAAARNQYATAADVMDQDLIYYVDTGSADAYAIAPNPAFTAYEEGQRVVFRAVNANTGASTLNVNSLGAIAIQTPAGAALEAGMIAAGGIYEVTYDANTTPDRWVLTSPHSLTVASSRSVSAGTGLTGGGDLSANRTISLSHLGIQSLADPNADRVLFWDDSAGAVAWGTFSTGLSVSGTTFTTNDGQIVHDNLSGFVSAEHVNHTSVTLTAGIGLSGGGDISASRTFNLDVAELTAFSGDAVDLDADTVIIDDGGAGTIRKATVNELITPEIGTTVTGTTDTLAESDFGKLTQYSSTSTVTITLPNGLKTGFWAVIRKTGASGTINLSAATTYQQADGLSSITKQYGIVTVFHLGSNVWTAWGDLA